MTCVAWNRKVEAILCSTSNAGLTVVWDLKSKKEVHTREAAGEGENTTDQRIVRRSTGYGCSLVRYGYVFALLRLDASQRSAHDAW